MQKYEEMAKNTKFISQTLPLPRCIHRSNFKKIGHLEDIEKSVFDGRTDICCHTSAAADKNLPTEFDQITCL